MEQSQPIVSLDSNTLIWGIRKKGQPDKVRRATYLFAKLEEEEAQIIIPSVVLAEFVTPLETRQKREAVIAEMRKRFVIAPFDARDAAVAADLWHYGKNKRQMKRANARVILRADTLIVATAYGYGAQIFYTDDDDCLNMAKKVIPDARKVSDTIAPNLFT